MPPRYAASAAQHGLFFIRRVHYDPLHYLALLEHKSRALDQTEAPQYLQAWKWVPDDHKCTDELLRAVP
jgi:hypothetical protein